MSPSHHAFLVGESYTRKDVYDTVGVPKNLHRGDWETGYHRHQDTFFIFVNVGVAGQTGHNYANRFEGDRLVWYGKTAARLQHPSIQALLDLGRLGQVYVFYRTRKRGGFVYAGLGRPAEISDEVPVRVVWAFDNFEEFHPERPPEEVNPSEIFMEGAVSRVLVNIYERNPAARRVCIEHWGHQCAICNFDFGKIYGEIGRGFIHVHHVKPLYEIGDLYEVDPINDLLPVCPNCHAMLHRTNPSQKVEALRQIVMSFRKKSDDAG